MALSASGAEDQTKMKTEKSWNARLLRKTGLIFLTSLAAMTLYQALKRLLFPRLTLDASMAVTAVVASLFVTAAAYVVMRYYERIRNRLAQQIKIREEQERALQASLREKDLLLREIHHRVKNNLQVVSSLINLQAGKGGRHTSRTGLKESQDRIRSMALIHEKLYRSRDLSRIDFSEYLRGLTSHLVQSYGLQPGKVRTELDLERSRLDINTAIPCGLLVNEIISNAFKHAFPGKRKGIVRVGFHRLGSSRFELMVADNGVGLPRALDIRKTRSLGMQIILMLVEQLDAALDVGRKGGAEFKIRFQELRAKKTA